MQYIQKNRVMIFGADVNHARVGSMRPSFAAVTGSLDADARKHAAVLQPQSPRLEIIQVGGQGGTKRWEGGTECKLSHMRSASVLLVCLFFQFCAYFRSLVSPLPPSLPPSFPPSGSVQHGPEAAPQVPRLDQVSPPPDNILPRRCLRGPVQGGVAVRGMSFPSFPPSPPPPPAYCIMTLFKVLQHEVLPSLPPSFSPFLQVPALKDACPRTNPKYNPTLTFVIISSPLPPSLPPSLPPGARHQGRLPTHQSQIQPHLDLYRGSEATQHPLFYAGCQKPGREKWECASRYGREGGREGGRKRRR